MCNLKSSFHCLGKARTLLPGAIRLFAALSVFAGTTFASAEELITKDSDMQAIYFLDKHAVADAKDMKHHYFQPELEGYVSLDGVSEGGQQIGFFSVHYNTDKELYQIWYRLGSKMNYAESKDGINWVTPEGVENPVFTGMQKARRNVVSFDPYDPDPSRRYKTPYIDGDELAHLAYSTDGIDWRVDTETIWHPRQDLDTENNIFYNPFAEKWQIITRPADGDRRIAMTDSADLKTWSDPIVLLQPGPMDPIAMDFYGMPVNQYGDIFLGLLWKYERGAGGGVIEPELTYSYNGLIWNRTYETFIERSRRGPYMGARIYSESIIQNHEGDISIYSRAYLAEHGSAKREIINNNVVVLHKMRKDGFAGFESIGKKGSLRTKAFVLKGDDLQLNVNAPYGSVLVQLTDESGKPYPGYTFEDSIEWYGDDVAYRPQWKDKKDVSELVGKKVCFDIRMVEGILYAIRVPVNPGYMKPPIKRM